MSKCKNKSNADPGKWAEGEVHDYLNNVNLRRHDFDYERLPDARAAMGRVAAQVADFAFYTPQHHGVIEVKETENEFRLPVSKIRQIARIKKRYHAGGKVSIVVYQSRLDLWRLIEGYQFANLDALPPSFDLAVYPMFASAEDALESTGWFK